MSILKDERGQWSAARCLLTGWLLNAAVRLWVTRGEVSNPELAFYTAIGTALVAWAGGPRIAAYVGPQASAAAQSVAQALRTAIQKRRASGEHEETP